MPDFPQLPIIQLPNNTPPAPPRKTQAEKYGGLFYMGIGGLAFLALLLASFGSGVWGMRDVWRKIYVLNDPRAGETERVRAALDLSRDSRVTSRQKWDLALSRVPPDLGRYLIAETLTSDALADDPRAYALAVSRSEGWPDWLRMLLARPLAYGAGEGTAIPRESLDELARSKDPILVLWAKFAMAVGTPGDAAAARADLTREAATSGPRQELARLLVLAFKSPQPARSEYLDKATTWLRANHPDARRVWEKAGGVGALPVGSVATGGLFTSS